MPDGRRRSREGWADSMESGPPEAQLHVHRLPGGVRVALIGLSAAVFLMLVALCVLTVYVYQANQYVQGRGEFRDREAQRIEQAATEEVRRAACEILAALPTGDDVIERVRAQFDCPPGQPLDPTPIP